MTQHKNNKEIPVVFMHWSSNCADLHRMIALAQVHNERVLLIGDRAAHMGVVDIPNLEVYNSAKYNWQIKDLAGVWELMSTFEHNICMRRWFILLEFMKQHDLHCVFTCDSDYALFTDVNIALQDYPEKPVLIEIPNNDRPFRWSCAASASYWTRSSLQQFCDLILNTYGSKDGMALLRSKWNWHKRTGAGGGVCDMTLLYLFSLAYPDQVGNLLVPVGDDPHVFDLSINASEGCTLDEYTVEHNKLALYNNNTIKQIQFIRGRPWGYNKRLQRAVRFDGLHFQGGAENMLTGMLRRTDK